MIVRAVASAYEYISSLPFEKKQRERTYGGIVKSCASAALKPRSLMIDGYKTKSATWPWLFRVAVLTKNMLKV